MGLNTTHGAFDGAYSAFNRFRRAVAIAAGGSYPPHPEGFMTEDGTLCEDQGMFYLDTKAHPGITLFLASNDCEGSFSPDQCEMIAREMEELLPRIDDGEDWGHIAAAGGMKAVAQRYIDGCRLAASLNEELEYH